MRVGGGEKGREGEGEGEREREREVTVRGGER
jgi:hypothetical protein